MEKPPTSPPPSNLESRFSGRSRWLVLLGLILLLGGVIYFPVRQFEFLNFDDGRFIAENPWLQHGINGASLSWAFGANLTEHSFRAEYWSPLTLLSRLADATIYGGMRPGGFHVTSVLLHLLNALLLCSALARLTGSWLRSAIVALLFLVHPLNVEPVCWLSARKDVLSATFFFLTLLAYAWFAAKPTLGRYLALLGAFTACLMAKPMGVTIPFVLMILDWWPLQRWEKARGDRVQQTRLLAEKIPLLMLAIGGAILAVLSQQDTGAIQTAGAMPFAIRFENALVSYAVYVRRVFWPSDLAMYYPHPGASLPIGYAIAAALFLIAVSASAWLLRRRAPYLLAGWLWFGVVLGPVIGLVQIGGQAMADRYAYPSVIGLFIAIVWGAAGFLETRSSLALPISAAAAILALAACSMHQVQFWKNSVAAFSRAIAVTKNNGLAYLNLGGAYLQLGDLANARVNYLKSLEIMPAVPIAWRDLGLVEQQLGNVDEALKDFHKALEIDPKEAKSLVAISRIELERGQKADAVIHLQLARQADPMWDEPYRALGNLYMENREWREAARMWGAYLQLHPDNAAARAADQRAVQEMQRNADLGRKE
jgi:tetratricopeptide (TPR) repeat protein